MSEPPSYEESTGRKISAPEEKDGSVTSQKSDIRSKVESSRAQHVLMVAHYLTPRIQDRAKRGLSDSNFILMPAGSGQIPKGELVLSEGDSQEIVELNGCLDTIEFWRQEQALKLLASQVHSAIAGERPRVEDLQLEPRPVATVKRAWWSRRTEKTKEPASDKTQPEPDPVQIVVRWGDVHFRTETPTGLMETVRADGIFVKVKIS